MLKLKMAELDNKIIDLFQEMARGQGMADSLLVIIFAKLYLEPEPIAMEDLAKETGYSLASICNKVNMLAGSMQIKKIRKPGTKKIYLYMEKDFLKIWKEALIKKEKYVIKRAKEKLPPLIKEYKDKARSGIEKEKLKNLENYLNQILKLEKVINKMIGEFTKLE